jgi:hypothetical protein
MPARVPASRTTTPTAAPIAKVSAAATTSRSGSSTGRSSVAIVSRVTRPASDHMPRVSTTASARVSSVESGHHDRADHDRGPHQEPEQPAARGTPKDGMRSSDTFARSKDWRSTWRYLGTSQIRKFLSPAARWHRRVRIWDGVRPARVWRRGPITDPCGVRPAGGAGDRCRRTDSGLSIRLTRWESATCSATHALRHPGVSDG